MLSEQGSGPSARGHRLTTRVRHGSNEVSIGTGAPIVVQSMTNTDTADVAATAAQVRDLARAGSELVRFTVNTPAAAAAVPAIRERLDAGAGGALIGDFHYNGHKLLGEYPACARDPRQVPHQPRQRGPGRTRDAQFASICQAACRPRQGGAHRGQLRAR